MFSDPLKFTSFFFLTLQNLVYFSGPNWSLKVHQRSKFCFGSTEVHQCQKTLLNVKKKEKKKRKKKKTTKASNHIEIGLPKKRRKKMISIFLFTVCIESIVEYSIHDSNNFEIQKQALKNLHQGVASMYRIATILFLAKMMTSICKLKVERLKLSQKSIF